MDIGIYSLNAARYLSGEEPTEMNAMSYTTPGERAVQGSRGDDQLSIALSQRDSCELHVKELRLFWRIVIVCRHDEVELEPATIYSGLRMHLHKNNLMEEV